MRMGKKVATILTLTLIFFFVQSHVILALSLGPLNLKSKPGEKFRAVVPIELEPIESADDLIVTLGNRRDYSLIGETMPEGLDRIHVALLRAGGIKALLYSDEVTENITSNIVLKALLDGGTMLKKYSLKLGQDISRTVGLTQKRETAHPQIYGPVNAGETLSGIAARLGYRGPEMAKAIVAIWLSNKSDFVAANLHGVKKGALLHIANVDEHITGISSREARYVISTQWEKWQKITRAATIKVAGADEPAEPVVKGPASVKPAPVKTASLRTDALPILPGVEEMMAVPTTVELARAESSPKAPLATTTEKQSAQEQAYMAGIQSLRGEMKGLVDKLNGEVLLLQNRLKEQMDIAQSSSKKLFLLFYAFLGENLVLIVVLLLSRRRMAHRRSYPELEGAALNERAS